MSNKIRNEISWIEAERSNRISRLRRAAEKADQEALLEETAKVFGPNILDSIIEEREKDLREASKGLA